MSRRSLGVKKRSEKASIRFDTGSGFGSTNTYIRTFTTKTEYGTNRGMVATTSSTLGWYVTITKRGMYWIQYQDDSTTNNNHRGISKNLSGSQLTADPNGISNANRLVASTGHLDGTDMTAMGFCGYFESGDTIWPHGNAQQNKTTNVYFEVVRLF